MRWLVLCVGLGAAPAAATGQATAEPARQAVLETVRGFHAALTAGDTAAAVRVLHRDAVIYEGGHAETLAEYRSGHLRFDMLFASATDRAVTAEAVELLDGAALYTSESHTTGRVNDREIDSHGVETIVLIRTPEGWRIRHIHWSSRR